MIQAEPLQNNLLQNQFKTTIQENIMESQVAVQKVRVKKPSKKLLETPKISATQESIMNIIDLESIL
jgi:predicted rRNA methylase YqxC with S4 and FtsJ domains